MSPSKYAESLASTIVGNMSSDTIIFFLKNQLMEAANLNHNLKRVISLLVWKLNIEKMSVNIHEIMEKNASKSVISYQKLIANSSVKHENINSKLDKLSYEITLLKETLCSQKACIPRYGSFYGFQRKLRKSIKIQPLKIIPFSCEKKTSKTISKGMVKPFKEFLFGEVANQKTLEEGQPQIEVMNETEEKEMEKDAATRRSSMNKIFKPSKDSFELHNAIGENPDIEALERNLRDAQFDISWHKSLTSLLMEEITKTREQLLMYKNHAEESRISTERIIQTEIKHWRDLTSSLKV